MTRQKRVQMTNKNTKRPAILARWQWLLVIGGLTSAAIAVIAPWIGLGGREDFILYRLTRISRRDWVLYSLALTALVAFTPWVLREHRRILDAIKKSIIPALLICVSILATFVIAEIPLRLAYLPDPWTTRNFSVDVVNQQVSNFAIQYDPTIGYIARPGFRGGDQNTHGVMGVRVNKTLKPGEPSPPLPQGGILAAGDSFTFGSEVKDDESWPAQLETATGVPVVNTGAGGYGLDQAVLRAEQFIDVIKPRAIILAFIPNQIGRNEYSVNTGLIKPYFDVVDNKLELRNVPVPDYQPPLKYVGVVRKVFGYSYSISWVADRIGLRKHWQVNEAEIRTVHNKGIEVSCLLWGRIAERVAGRNIRLVAMAEYAGIQINGHDKARDYYQVEKVLGCAKNAGFLVVDSYHELRRRYEADEKSFWNLWVRQSYDKDWNTGHMSAEGNKVMMELLVSAMRKNMPDILAK